MQASSLFDPASSFFVPGLQGKQKEIDVAFGVGPYLPGLQAVHALSVVAPLASLQYPDGQDMQSSISVLPC